MKILAEWDKCIRDKPIPICSSKWMWFCDKATDEYLILSPSCLNQENHKSYINCMLIENKRMTSSIYYYRVDLINCLGES